MSVLKNKKAKVENDVFENDILSGLKPLSAEQKSAVEIVGGKVKTPQKADENNDVKLKKINVKAKIRRRRIVSLLIILVLFAAAAYPAYTIWYEPYSCRQYYLRLKENLGESANAKLPAGVSEKYGALYSINSDLAGWIVVSGAYTGYPVVSAQSQENEEFYSDHLFNKDKGSAGTPCFAEEYSEIKTGKVAVIKGKSGVFGDFSKYLSADYYKNAPTISFDTLYEESFWKIYACARIDTGVKMDITSAPSITSTEELSEYVKAMCEYSAVITPVNVMKNDELLTVILDDGADSVALAARKVRDGEDAAISVSGVYKHTPGDKNYNVFVSPSDLAQK